MHARLQHQACGLGNGKCHMGGKAHDETCRSLRAKELASTHHAALGMPPDLVAAKKAQGVPELGQRPRPHQTSTPANTHAGADPTGPYAPSVQTAWQLRQHAYDVRPQVFVHQVLLP
jgi:hypothetical protein